VSTLAARIRADLEGKIRSGEWQPGVRIPTELELTQRYGCARMTVHRAIAALVAEGLIERRKKAGSFVARPHVQTAVIEIPDIAAIIEARGEAYRFELLDRRLCRARELGDASTAADFQLKGRVLILDGLHVADRRPFCFEHRIIALGAAPEAEDIDFTNRAPGSWLLGHIPWSEARHRVTACNAGTMGARLGIARTAACLSVERWTWRLGEPVTFVRQVFPGDRYDLIAQFSPR
jgi:GntR family histidine utilization transcriptional repressor